MEGIDKNTFKQIFHDHWDTFRKLRPPFDSPDYNETIKKMLDCGDPEKMGFVQYRCCYCGQTRRIAFTCKSCFCLSCAKVYTDRWAEFIPKGLLPGVTYRHVILTIPEFLRVWFFRNPELLSPFMRAGHACIKDILQTCTGVKKLDIGNIVVLQTAGRSRHYNPHLHILMTAGGLDKKGNPTRWKSVSYIPYDMMHRKWQYHLLKMLRQNVSDLSDKSDPNIEKDIDRAWTDYPNGFVAFLQEGEVPLAEKVWPAIRWAGWLNIWQSMSYRRLSRFAGLKNMTVNLSATGIGIIKQDKLSTKPSLPSNSLDEWYSTSCRRAFRESDIMDCMAMYVTKRSENTLPKLLLPTYPSIPELTGFCLQNLFNNASLKASVKIPCFVPSVAAICRWN